MATQPIVEDGSEATHTEVEAKPMALSWVQRLQEQYQKAKEDEHADIRARAWGSYVLVYGFFGLYLTLRWRKLRKTEDRVRILQDKIRKQYAEESARSASLRAKLPPPADKATK